jgi:hypothetical protein
MRDIEQIAFEEVIKRRAYCAVTKIEFAKHLFIANEPNEIFYFTIKREYEEWLNALEDIYDYGDRPTKIHTIYNPSAEWC